MSEIRELNVSECKEAANVLACAMRDNPINVAAWRLEHEARQQVLTSFFESVLRGQFTRGSVLGAIDNGKIVGVCVMTPPGQCQPSNAEKLRILSTVLLSGNLMATPRILQWARAWSQHDPAKPHWHVGGLAVDPSFQGHGVGGQLMTTFCKRVDACNAQAYLETDKQANVGFYQKYGFQVNSESQVLGIPNWFMMRPSQN